MSEWRKLNRNCTHCGRRLMAKPARNDSGMTIVGLERMEYTHANGSHGCPQPPITTATPYTGWGAYDEWVKAGDIDGDLEIKP